jgi:hypothetical protein
MLTGESYGVTAPVTIGLKSRSPSTYLWAMLLARVYEVFPLLCPRCGELLRLRRIALEIRARQVVEQHIEADVEQISPSTHQVIEQRRLVLEWSVMIA